MAIKLGLQRMQALYGESPQLWKAIHVAGTNGKGSVCSYVSALLTRAHISHGRFTSPYIRRPEDSILINNVPIPSALFQSFYFAADKSPAADKPTHFERMTYAAFAAFDHFGVKYGVVETGLGGRLDSTNVLQNKAVTVITKIGLDHQEYLGDSIEQIAAEKAGIMNGAPCVIGEQSSPAVLPVLLDSARRVGSSVILATSDSEKAAEPGSRPWPQHMLENARCAIKACEQLDEFKGSTLNLSDLLNQPRAHMEGRLQTVNTGGMGIQRRTPIILDGAHNMDAAAALARHTRTNLRRTKEGSQTPITWVIGMSHPRGNTAYEFLEALVHDEDKVVFTEYSRPTAGQGDMTLDDHFLSYRPEPLPRAKLEEAIKSVGRKRNRVESRAALDQAMETAFEMARVGSSVDELPIVVTGSLYLVADALKWIDTCKKSCSESPPRPRHESGLPGQHEEMEIVENEEADSVDSRAPGLGNGKTQK